MSLNFGLKRSRGSAHSAVDRADDGAMVKPSRGAAQTAAQLIVLLSLSLMGCGAGSTAPRSVMAMCLAVPAIDETGPSQTRQPISVLFRGLGNPDIVRWRKQGSTHVFEVPREDVANGTMSKLVFEMREIDLQPESACGPGTLMVSRAIGSNGDEITGYAVWDAVMGVVQQATLDQQEQPAAAPSQPQPGAEATQVTPASQDTRDAELRAGDQQLNDTYTAVMGRLLT